MHMVLSDQFLDEQRAVGDAQADNLVQDYMSTGRARQLYQILGQEDAQILLQGRAINCYPLSKLNANKANGLMSREY